LEVNTWYAIDVGSKTMLTEHHYFYSSRYFFFVQSYTSEREKGMHSFCYSSVG
jgi:hypothetical protein